MAAFDDGIKQENLKYLSDCPKLSLVDFRRTRIADLGVKYLSKCSNLTTVRIGGNPAITDACIKDLLKLKHVDWLDLDGTHISGSGLKMLKPMNLHRLSVTKGSFAAKDLPLIKGLANLIEICPQSPSLDEGSKQMFAPTRF